MEVKVENRFTMPKNVGANLGAEPPLFEPTYIRLAREFVYLAVALDVFSRKVIGWDLGRSLKSPARSLFAWSGAIAN
jgi:transposase InsO family protein